MKEILMVVTTESDENKAKNIAKALVQNKLAACVSIKKIFSIFKWQGLIEETQEFEITIKSKPELKEKIIEFLKKISSYEITQILYKKFNSESNYHEWLNKTI